jgi:hypothetical protein
MLYGVNHQEDPCEYRKRQSQARRQRHPVRYLYSQAKYRAKKLGLEFDIELADLVIPDRCPVFDIPLFFTSGRRTHNSFSIDRWDNSKGYVKGNVRIISWKANQYKGNLTTEEVRNLLNYMEGK